MIRQTEKGVIIKVRVKPNAKSFGFAIKDGHLIIEVASHPRRGRANLEVVKGLKKVFGKDAEIVKGFKSREKVILVKGMNTDEINRFLLSLESNK